MKKLLFLLLIAGNIAFSQTDGITIGAHFHPGFSKVYNGFHKLVDFNLCYNAGIDLRANIPKSNFYLESGIGWNEYGIRTTIIFTDNFGNPTGESKNKETYFFLSLPLNATYKLGGWQFSGGAMLSYYVMRKYIVDGVLIGKDAENLQGRFFAAFNLKVGYEFNIGQNWLLGTEAFSNLMLGPDFYNFGIGISSRYILTKTKEKSPNLDEE